MLSTWGNDIRLSCEVNSFFCCFSSPLISLAFFALSPPVPRAPGQLNPTAHREDGQRLRLAREAYVPQRLNRLLREEGRLMLDFDASTTIEGRLKALDGLLRIRRMVMDMVGWPKPPTMRPGKLPAALETVRHLNPFGDIAVSAVVAEVLPPGSATVVEPAPERPPDR